MLIFGLRYVIMYLMFIVHMILFVNPILCVCLCLSLFNCVCVCVFECEFYYERRKTIAWSDLISVHLISELSPHLLF